VAASQVPVGPLALGVLASWVLVGPPALAAVAYLIFVGPLAWAEVAYRTSGAHQVVVPHRSYCRPRVAMRG
jgi:hypothetical protein